MNSKEINRWSIILILLVASYECNCNARQKKKWKVGKIEDEAEKVAVETKDFEKDL